MSRRAFLVTLLVAASMLVGCDQAGPPPIDRLVIAGGAPGTVYDMLGRAFADIARQRGVDAQVLTTAASVENVRMVADGRADIGFAAIDAAAAALHGDAPFNSAMPITALAGLYDDYLHIVVRADDDIHHVSDLRGRTISTGPAGSGTNIVTNRVLQTAGLQLGLTDSRELSPTDAAHALSQGEIDAFFLTGGLPTATVTDLAATIPIRVLSVPDEVGELQRRYGDLYQSRSIPVSTYGFDDEVQTLGVRNLLVARTDMAEPVAHWITELLFDARSELATAHREARRLDPRSAVATFPLPLHPGAARYYLDSKPLARSQLHPFVSATDSRRTDKGALDARYLLYPYDRRA